MRINARLMAEHIKMNLAKQSSQLVETQLQLATGKRINKISDDPIGMGKVLDYRTAQNKISQYRENIVDANTRVAYTETILGQVSELIEDAKKIATNPDTENKSPLAQQVANIREQLIGLANSKYSGNYIFAGDATDTAPFDSVSPHTYNGDDGSHQVVVGEGITIDIEADGSQIFTDGTDNLFEVLENLETALSADPCDASAVDNTVDPLYRLADRVELARSENASDYKRLERTDAHWSSFYNAVENMRSTVEDADITQAAIDIQNQQTSYEILLATAADIIQPSLIDFLG